MIKEHEFYSLGSGWLSASGYGFTGSTPRFSDSDIQFKYPELQEYIPELPPRFGRFDIYTKVSFTTAVLALKDAGLLQRDGKKNIGIIIGSFSSVYDDDIAFFKSTREANGSFASPNLFSYTLPVVALGEIAVYFKFIGPTFCVGNDPTNPGLDVMSAALSLLASDQCENVLVGWVEASQNIINKDHFPKGAAFAVLTLAETNQVKAEFSFNQNFRFAELIKG